MRAREAAPRAEQTERASDTSDDCVVILVSVCARRVVCARALYLFYALVDAIRAILTECAKEHSAMLMQWSILGAACAAAGF